MTDKNGKCRRCGACCSGLLIVEAGVEDVEREPRIEQECLLLDGHGSIPRDQATWSVACGVACGFLGSDHKCGIYDTRPDECRGFLAGGEQCLRTRAEAFAMVNVEVGE